MTFALDKNDVLYYTTYANDKFYVYKIDQQTNTPIQVGKALDVAIDTGTTIRPDNIGDFQIAFDTNNIPIIFYNTTSNIWSTGAKYAQLKVAKLENNAWINVATLDGQMEYDQHQGNPTNISYDKDGNIYVIYQDGKTRTQNNDGFSSIIKYSNGKITTVLTPMAINSGGAYPFAQILINHDKLYVVSRRGYSLDLKTIENGKLSANLINSTDFPTAWRFQLTQDKKGIMYIYYIGQNNNLYVYKNNQDGKWLQVIQKPLDSNDSINQIVNLTFDNFNKPILSISGSKYASKNKFMSNLFSWDDTYNLIKLDNYSSDQAINNIIYSSNNNQQFRLTQKYSYTLFGDKQDITIGYITNITPQNRSEIEISNNVEFTVDYDYPIQNLNAVILDSNNSKNKWRPKSITQISPSKFIVAFDLSEFITNKISLQLVAKSIANQTSITEKTYSLYEKNPLSPELNTLPANGSSINASVNSKIILSYGSAVNSNIQVIAKSGIKDVPVTSIEEVEQKKKFEITLDTSKLKNDMILDIAVKATGVNGKISERNLDYKIISDQVVVDPKASISPQDGETLERTANQTINIAYDLPVENNIRVEVLDGNNLIPNTVKTLENNHKFAINFDTTKIESSFNIIVKADGIDDGTSLKEFKYNVIEYFNPTISHITPDSTQSLTSSGYEWTIHFDQDVTGVNDSSFSLIAPDSLVGFKSIPLHVTKINDSTYRVSGKTHLTLDAYYELHINDNQTIRSIKGQKLLEPTMYVYKVSSGSWILTPNTDSGNVTHTAATVGKNNELFIVYSDNSNNGKTTVKTLENGSWKLVGNRGFSDSAATNQQIALDKDDSPYVIFKDKGKSDKTSVMKFNGINWEYVGERGFSAQAASDQQIAIINNVPYAAYIQKAPLLGKDKVIVEKFNGSKWVSVGEYSSGVKFDGIQGNNNYMDMRVNPVNNEITIAFANTKGSITVLSFNHSTGTATILGGSANIGNAKPLYIALAISQTGDIFVSAQDNSYGGRTTVYKVSKDSWKYVGEQGISDKYTGHQSIDILPNGYPVIAFENTSKGDKTSVMYFDGIDWSIFDEKDTISSGKSYYQQIKSLSTGGFMIIYQDKENNSQAEVKLYN